MKITKSGSVRVDLLGGTLDIYPINVVLPEVKTINMATDLMAKVTISEESSKKIIFKSLDYDVTKEFSLSDLLLIDTDSNPFGQFDLVARIINFFKPKSGIRVDLSSGAPPGSGLGGSSAMGAVLFSACSDYFSCPYDREKMISIVQTIESKILNAGPAGYQDYYPSLFGGILSLNATDQGVVVEQFYDDELANFLSNNIKLIYSGETRKSGINNWEVFKGFFDNVPSVREGLKEINDITNKGYSLLKSRNYAKFLEMIEKEGDIREGLFPGIMTEKMKAFKSEILRKKSSVGIKVCGAGGGGCFIITNGKGIQVDELLDKYEMKELSLNVFPPREY